MDAVEFEQLVRDNAGVVRSLVYHILRTQSDVEDVTQEVFIKAYHALPAFRGGNFRAFVCRIARNHCYDILRKQKTRKSIHDTEALDERMAAPTAGPEELLVAAELASEVQALLAQMSRIDREILLLKHVHGYNYEEIAEMMNMRVGAVRTRISRARARLTAMMQGGENGEPSLMG